MTNSPYRLPLIDLRADDAEIARYAALLDSLSIGLLVFAADGSLQQRNTQADTLLEHATTIWEDDNGEIIAAEDRLEMVVIETRQPVRQRAIGLRAGESGPVVWCSASAFPVFADDGGIRRVLLTLADLSRHNWLASETQELPTHDPLTGVFAQRYISLLLDDEGRRARRYGTPFAVALIAIDHFREFCERHGAQTGELVLADVGRLISGCMREFDMIGRFDNDHFLLILPNVRVNEAIVGLERLREQIETTHAENAEVQLTISGGVSEFTGEDSAALIECVRSLLNDALEAGGNRICVDLDFF